MRTLISILLLVSLPAMVGLSGPLDLATERRAAIIATNAANAVVAPVSNLAANAQSLALDALARPVGVSSGYVASVVATARVSRVESADSSGAYNQITGSAIYQTSITPTVPESGFTFSSDFSANGIPPPSAFVLGQSFDGWSSGIKMFPQSPAGPFIQYDLCYWRGENSDGTNFIFTSDGLHGETGNAIMWPMGRPAQTNTVIYRLSESSASDLIAEHNGGTSAHNGRLTALEARPTGLTTNDVLPWITLADNYSTNGALRVVVSNRIFSIWGLK